jgi:hypothetical protein
MKSSLLSRLGCTHGDSFFATGGFVRPSLTEILRRSISYCGRVCRDRSRDCYWCSRRPPRSHSRRSRVNVSVSVRPGRRPWGARHARKPRPFPIAGVIAAFFDNRQSGPSAQEYALARPNDGGFDERGIIPSVLEPSVLPSSPSQCATHDRPARPIAPSQPLTLGL